MRRARPGWPVTDHPAALALAGLLSLVVAIGIGRFVYTPILPYMTAGLGLTKSQAGLLASANYLGYLLGALAVARRAPPGDPRRWLLGALAVSGLSTGAMALTTGLAPFLLLRFANGAAGALAMVLGSALVMDRLAIAGRAGWASVMYVGVGGGVTISALAVPAIAAGAGDWKSPWLLCGAIALTLSLAVAALLRRPPAATRRRANGRQPGAGAALSGASFWRTASSGSATSPPRPSSQTWCAPIRCCRRRSNGCGCASVSPRRRQRPCGTGPGAAGATSAPLWRRA